MMAEGEDGMNRKERRAEARRGRQRPLSDEERARGMRERVELLEFNRPEALAMAGGSPDGDVVIVANMRDPYARKWLRAFGQSDADIDRQSAPSVLANMIPTAVMVVSRDAAIDVAANANPDISEKLEQTPVSAGRVLIVLAADGAAMDIEPPKAGA
jgi:hypothetical protein